MSKSQEPEPRPSELHETDTQVANGSDTSGEGGLAREATEILDEAKPPEEEGFFRGLPSINFEGFEKLLRMACTYGLSVVLVFWYLLRIGPDHEKERNKWYTEISGIRQDLGRILIGPLTTEQTKHLGELGLERNQLALTTFVDRMIDQEGFNSDAFQAEVMKILRETRSRWDEFGVTLGKYRKLSGYFGSELDQLISKAIEEAQEVLEGTEGREEKRRKVHSVISVSFQQALNRFHEALNES